MKRALAGLVEGSRCRLHGRAGNVGSTKRRKVVSAAVPLKNIRCTAGWFARNAAKLFGMMLLGIMLLSRLPVRSQLCNTSHRAMPAPVSLDRRSGYGRSGLAPSSAPMIFQKWFRG